MLEFSTLTWRKSSHSAQNGACVEVGTGRSSAHIAVRDSKNPDRAGLAFSQPEFRSFVAKVKTL